MFPSTSPVYIGSIFDVFWFTVKVNVILSVGDDVDEEIPDGVIWTVSSPVYDTLFLSTDTFTVPE